MNGLIQLGNSFNAILNFIYPKSTIAKPLIAPMPLSCNFIPVYTIHPCFFHKILFKMTKLPSPHLQPLAEFKAEHVAAVGGHVGQAQNFLQSTGTGAASHVPSGPSYCPLLVPHRMPVCVGAAIDEHNEEGLEPAEQRVGAARGQRFHQAWRGRGSLKRQPPRQARGALRRRWPQAGGRH
jgi:hypothetical protein